MGYRVVMDPPSVVYAKVFYEGSSPDRYLKRETVAVAARARRLAPKKSGRLAASVSVQQNRDPRGRFAFGYGVGADAPYAAYVHEGTGPSIRVTYPNKMKFEYRGSFVYVTRVFHPGTPAQPFLLRALAGLGR